MCAYLVITPAHNEETLLPNLIDSLAAQVIKPKRWILIDDGSEDRTPDIVDEAASQISWIKACHLFGLRCHDARASLSETVETPASVLRVRTPTQETAEDCGQDNPPPPVHRDSSGQGGACSTCFISLPE